MQGLGQPADIWTYTTCGSRESCRHPGIMQGLGQPADSQTSHRHLGNPKTPRHTPPLAPRTPVDTQASCRDWANLQTLRHLTGTWITHRHPDILHAPGDHLDTQTTCRLQDLPQAPAPPAGTREYHRCQVSCRPPSNLQTPGHHAVTQSSHRPPGASGHPAGTQIPLRHPDIR